MRVFCHYLVSSWLFLVFSPLLAQSTLYELTVLQPLGTASSAATHVNDWQGITGYSRVGLAPHAVLWSQGNTLDLGNLLNSFSSQGLGIADTGDVVGGATAFSFFSQHPFLYRDGMATFLSTSNAGKAQSVNNLGGVAGSWTYSTHTEAFFWSDSGGFEDLHNIYSNPDSSQIYALNDKQQAVGFVHPTGTDLPKAYVWQKFGSSWVDNVLEDIDDLNRESTAHDINELGVVAGHWDNRAVYWRKIYHIWPAKILDPIEGTSSSEALGINNANQIVGYVILNGKSRAFYWSCGKMIDLNNHLQDLTTFVFQRAQSISDTGDIVGYGQYKEQGPVYAAMLRPVVDLINP